MAYKRQLQVALDRFDQGLARVHGMVKRGKNADAIYFMENDLKELYDRAMDANESYDKYGNTSPWVYDE